MSSCPGVLVSTLEMTKASQVSYRVVMWRYLEQVSGSLLVSYSTSRAFAGDAASVPSCINLKIFKSFNDLDPHDPHLNAPGKVPISSRATACARDVHVFVVRLPSLYAYSFGRRLSLNLDLDQFLCFAMVRW